MHKSVTALCLCLPLAYGIPAARKNGDTSILSLSTNATDLASPLGPSPPGFRPELHWDTSVPLPPTAIYVTSIKLMYELSAHPWSSPVDPSHPDLSRISYPGYNALIHFSAIPPTSQLTTALAVRALHDLILSMARADPGFFKVTSNLRLHSSTIGRIRITTPDPTPPLNPTLNPLLPPAAPTTPQNNSLATLPPPSLLLDPENPRFALSYQYTGANLRSRDMFSAILAGLASVAQYNADGPCRWITTFSASGDVVFHIGALPNQALFGWHISRMFYLLVYHLFLVRRVVKEMRVGVFYYGTLIAEGEMRLM